LRAVQRFLESPLQGSARFALGLRDDEEAPLEEAADEPMDLERRARFALLRAALFAPDPEATWRAGFERAVLDGHAPVGPFAERRVREDLTTLRTWAANLQAARLPSLSEWLVVRVGRASEHERVDLLLPEIELEVPIGGGAVWPVKLHGSLLPIQPDGRAALSALGVEVPSDKHFLSPFLSLVALSAAGRPPPAPFRALVTPTAPNDDLAQLERGYYVPPPDLARDWLARVLGELLASAHEYRLPIEAVLQWERRRREEPGAPYWRVRGGPDSDRYGPVRDVDRFPSPDTQTVAAVVSRRFGLWFEAGRR